MNTRTFILMLGGVAAVSDATGSSRSAVSNWGAQGIPKNKLAVLARLAKDNEVDLPADYWEV